MLKDGTCGFKCFLIHSGVDEFPHVNEEQVRYVTFLQIIFSSKALKELQGTDGFLMFHAEVEIEDQGTNNGDPREYETFLKSRFIYLFLSIIQKTQRNGE